MTTQNTLIFRVVATNPIWGDETQPGWPGASPVKSAPGYSLYDVQIDDANATISNGIETPTSVSLYQFPNNPLPSSTTPYQISRTAMTTTDPVQASAQALAVLEHMYAQQIQATDPSRIVVDFSGHGSPQVFFQGALTVSDSVKLLTYIKTISNGATLILDTSTNCNNGYVDFLQNYANAADYVMASEKEVGGFTPGTQALQYNHDASLSSAWAQGNTTTQAFSTLMSDLQQYWKASQSGLQSAGQFGEQNASVFDMSQFQSFMAKVGTLPSSTLAALPSSGDLASYIESSGNATLLAALQKFQIAYADTKGLATWTDADAGLAVESLSQLESFAAGAAGTTASGVSVASALAAFAKSHAYSASMIVDSSSNVATQLDALESYFEAAETYTTLAPGAIAIGSPGSGIELTDGGIPTLTITATQLVNDSYALSRLYSNYALTVTGVTVADAAGVASVGHVSGLAISDSAADIAAGLDSLQGFAAAGKLSSVTMTDTGIPTLTLTAAQLTADHQALADISSYYIISVAAPSSGSAALTGIAGRGTLVTFSGTAASYAITPTGDGSSLTVGSDHLSNVTALQFSDHQLFVASTTPVTTGAVSSAEVTNLYAAVFARTPDVAGLAYYEGLAAATPSRTITSFAVSFLSSPEYTNAHSYAQTSAGDAQFITDTYQNLLHRAPSSADVAWYQTNVINPILATATPNSTAYTQAELLAHASVLADFSQSGEFLGDVQVTSQHPADATHWLILV